MLFSLADALHLAPGRSIDEHAELYSCAEALLPWISVVCGLSCDHAIMSSIVERVGPFNALAFESPSILTLVRAGPCSTKRHVLITFLDAMWRLDALLQRLWLTERPADKASANVQPQACSEINRRCLTSCCTAARRCFQRLSVAVRVLHCILRACAHACICL